MDAIALTNALETALTRLHEVNMATRDVKVATPERRLLTEMQDARTDHELAKDVLPILQVQPEFKDKAPMINSMAGRIGFQSSFVAPALVHEARQRKSAKAAVTWLTKVLETNSGEGLIIQTLWGISPKQRISIWKGVELLPFEDLPHSRQKERLTDVGWPHQAHLPTPFFALQPPTAALIEKMEVRPFLIDANAEEKSTDKDISQDRPPLEVIRLCLALEGPSIIIAGPGWDQFVDPDLEAAVLAKGTSYDSQEVLPHHVLLNDSSEPASDVQDIVRAYMALASEKKKKIRIALERLHQALIRSDPAERALELSIALEALLIDSPGEHTFKLAYRAALLVSNDVEERTKTRAIIETAYTMRSNLVHSGSINPLVKVRGQGKKPVEEIANRAATITAHVIKRIIMQGGPPEWNRFELSDGRAWSMGETFSDRGGP